MSEYILNEKEKNEIKKAKRVNYIALCIVGVFFVAILTWLGYGNYWRSFSAEKWLKHPDKRAYMTADMLEEYELVGMTAEEITALLGEDYREDTEKNSRIYYLGSERTIIDSEWLVLEFDGDTVSGCSVKTD